MRTITKVGIGSVGAFALAFGLLAPTAAYANPAAGPGDVIGVGSDTVQYLVDFMAEGDPSGNAGFNAGQFNRVVNFDATPDANARLAYGNGGQAGLTPTTCAPGTGSTQGTGNSTGAGLPCVLNPTVVLRAGTLPVRIPNGSGDGATALAHTTDAMVNFSRASACQGPATDTVNGVPCSGKLTAAFDSVTIGTDQLAMLSASTTNAVPLSIQQLKLIYACTDTTWNQVGGTSTATIVPVLPQLGSGTRSVFIADIGATTIGTCVQTSEENDPTVPAQAGTNSANVIEPMSFPRLELWEGLNYLGTDNGFGGYFRDPSCKLGDTTTNPTACNATQYITAQHGPQILVPAVKEWLTGTPSDTNPIYTDQRALYIYFRDADIQSTTQFEPGVNLNWVRSLFYNPCVPANPINSGACVGSFGPGGAPYVDTAEGQLLIGQAGATPAYSFTPGGP
jgi:hypothetical protein